MDKVKLTKRQAEALEVAKELPVYVEKSEIVRLHNGAWAGLCRALNEIDLDTLIKALYIGYEVEQTPEDRILETYHRKLAEGTYEHAGQTIVSSRCIAFADGIKYALNELGHKIEGLNA